MHALGVSLDNEDVDYMFHSIGLNAFPLTQRVPVEYNREVLRVYTHGVHPGYARLIVERSGEELNHLRAPKYSLGRHREMRGPAHRHYKKEDMNQNGKYIRDEG